MLFLDAVMIAVVRPGSRSFVLALLRALHLDPFLPAADQGVVEEGQKKGQPAALLATAAASA